MPQRFVDIRYEGAADDWSTLASVAIVEATDGHVRLRVEPDVDVASLLKVAQRRANVTAFAYEPPTLSELFRQAVAA